MRQSKHYIEEADIIEQWRIWVDSAKEVADRSIPEKLVQQIYLIADHLLEHPRFNRYQYDTKEDMRQEAVIKVLKNLKNYNPSKGGIFSYFTRCCWTAFIVHLTEYYQDMNEKRQLVLETLNNMDETQLNATKYLKQLMVDLQESANEYDEG